MKINPKLICLSIVFTVLVVMASNVAAADTLEAGKLTKVASNVAFDSNPVWSPNGKEILFEKGSGNYGANLYKVLRHKNKSHLQCKWPLYKQLVRFILLPVQTCYRLR